jgi:hypothetical protein
MYSTGFKIASKKLQNYTDSNSAIIFSIASVVAELFTILLFFTTCVSKHFWDPCCHLVAKPDS